VLKVFVQSVKVGAFVRVADHFAQPRYRLRWWKVTAIEGRTVHLVDRNGTTAQWPCSTSASSRFLLWQPGDPRNDDQD
jgi:hypothetical protein